MHTEGPAKTTEARKPHGAEDLVAYFETRLSVNLATLQEGIDQAKMQIQTACDKELEARFELRELETEERATEKARKAAQASVDKLKQNLPHTHRKDSGVCLGDELSLGGDFFSQAQARALEASAFTFMNGGQAVLEDVYVFNGNLPERKTAAQAALTDREKEVEAARARLANLEGVLGAKHKFDKLKEYLNSIDELAKGLNAFRQQKEGDDEWAASLGI